MCVFFYSFLFLSLESKTPPNTFLFPCLLCPGNHKKMWCFPCAVYAVQLIGFLSISDWGNMSFSRLPSRPFACKMLTFDCQFEMRHPRRSVGGQASDRSWNVEWRGTTRGAVVDRWVPKESRNNKRTGERYGLWPAKVSQRRLVTTRQILWHGHYVP